MQGGAYPEIHVPILYIPDEAARLEALTRRVHRVKVRPIAHGSAVPDAKKPSITRHTHELFMSHATQVRQARAMVFVDCIQINATTNC